jgi:hypothetical protein
LLQSRSVNHAAGIIMHFRHLIVEHMFIHAGKLFHKSTPVFFLLSSTTT